MFKKAEKHKQMTRVIVWNLQFDMTLKFIEALKLTTNTLCFVLFIYSVLLLLVHRLQGQKITLPYVLGH